nr:MAG TPA: hypothetical protein [Bacteriophage sp.]DAI57871.1 MAG TPA: hypothetical protein [Caudoviricetes sp.]
MLFRQYIFLIVIDISLLFQELLLKVLFHYQ